MRGNIVQRQVLFIPVYNYGLIFCMSTVDVDAVDTYRPKVPRVQRLKETESSGKAGASGEIADVSRPILPLSPTLYPKTSTVASANLYIKEK